jgi:cystathionine beta-lyase/cystathionine gamma-synthase
MMSRKASKDGPGPSTLGVHAGSPPPAHGQPVVGPLVQSATFFGGGPGDPADLRYTRYGNNPNQLAVGKKLAALEGMEAALPLASGMAATALAFLALTRSGDHIVASRHLYGTTRKLLEDELPRRGVNATFVDPGSGRDWREAVRPNTRLLFLELPTNPTMRVFDPRPVGHLAAEEGIPLVADCTFASPVNFRAKEHGIDVVIHSATKYLGGHSDLIAGVVAGSRAFVQEVQSMLKLYGPALDPHAAWLLERGMRTLAVRMQRHNENGLALAAWLEAQPEVEAVLYPGLESHPDHGVARELMRGFGGMIGIVLRGGGPAADTFCPALGLALQAPSLGGVETLVSQPRFTSHVHQSAVERAEQGIPDGFVRISVGVEDAEDLKADFRQALDTLKSSAVA